MDVDSISIDVIFGGACDVWNHVGLIYSNVLYRKLNVVAMPNPKLLRCHFAMAKILIDADFLKIALGIVLTSAARDSTSPLTSDAWSTEEFSLAS